LERSRHGASVSGWFSGAGLGGLAFEFNFQSTIPVLGTVSIDD
jgi:hypothetical protein